MNLDSTINAVNQVKQRILQMNGEIGNLQHKDIAVNNYLNRAKKLSLQSIDLMNELQRQLSFLTNENRNYQIRQRMEERRKEDDKQRQARRERRMSNELQS